MLSTEPLVKIDDWKEKIQSAFDMGSQQDFHDAIWAMSMYAFDIPREVQVVIDKDAKLFMSVGTPGFVSFDGQFPEGMKIPLKEWIHTHPFGQAYFRGTDKNTVKIWHSLLESATVLGKHQKAVMKFRAMDNGKNHLYTHAERENRWNTVNQVMTTLWGDEEE